MITFMKMMKIVENGGKRQNVHLVEFLAAGV
jgi:hypothetical protein